jgi:hypothetical protein
MARPGERPQVLEIVALPRPEISKEQIGAFNEQVRESALGTQNVDKGFAHYVSYFKPTELVYAAIQGEQGPQGEYGWVVYFQQGRHGCVLTGVVSGRPAEEELEDAMWKACAELSSFQPVPGAEKEHEEHVYGIHVCTHCFEDQFQVGSEYYQQASPERKWLMEKFAAGCARTNFVFHPNDDLQERIVKHATNSVRSRRYQFADGVDFWQSQETSAPVVSPASQTALMTSHDPGSLLRPGGGWFRSGNVSSGR